MQSSKTGKHRRPNLDQEIVREVMLLSRKRDNWHGPLALTQDAAVIAAALFLYLANPWFYPASVLLIGTRQRALATLLHEAAHQTLCASRVLGVAIGMLAGWAVFQTYDRYHDSHVGNHHPHLGDEGRDPDAINYAKQGLYVGEPRTFFLRHLLPLLLGVRTPANVAILVRDRFLPTNFRALSSKARWEYVGFLGFWSTVTALNIWAGTFGQFVLLWIVPYLTVFQVVNGLIEIGEHFPLTRLSNGDLEITRNRYSTRLEAFFVGIHGEQWHLIHHLFPGLPFWLMRQTHKILMRDPAYAALASQNGGLLLQGTNGAPSILSQIPDQLGRVQALSSSNEVFPSLACSKNLTIN